MLESLMASSTREGDAQRSGAPQRNFTIPVEERVRAWTAGLPAYVRRLKSIEDLEDGIVRLLAQRVEEARASRIDPDAYARASAPLRALERLHDLVDRHNRWYPIEASLPMHPATGELLDRSGVPWRPLARREFDQLLARALAFADRSANAR